MKIFGFEIKRAFANVWFVLSVAIGTAIGVADCLLYVRQNGLGDDNRPTVIRWSSCMPCFL